MSISRNDPCPCGSGKKYKKCCLIQGEVISLAEARGESLSREVWKKFGDFIARSASEERMAMGLTRFFAAPMTEADLDEAGEMAMDWVAFAYRDGESTFCEQFAASGRLLSDQEREVLRAWAHSSPGFFRVEEAGRTCRLRRLPDGKEYDLRAPGMSLQPGDLISGWLLPVLSTHIVGFAVQDVAPEALEPLMYLVKIEMELMRQQRPGATWDELFREHWPRLTDAFALAVAEGEDLLRVSPPAMLSVDCSDQEPEEDPPQWQEVERLIGQAGEIIDEWVGPLEVEGALRLWRSGARAIRPRIVKPNGWVAAVLYLYVREVHGEYVTQAEAADLWCVSPSTVGKYSRQLAEVLQLRPFDPRYVDPMDPLVRMHWHLHWLEALRNVRQPMPLSLDEQAMLARAMRAASRGSAQGRSEGPIGEAELLIDQAWDTSGSSRIRLAKEALRLWPDAADAYVLLGEAAQERGDLREAKRHYEAGVQAGERALGPQFFAEQVGHFYGILESRPYMRARASLAGCLWELGARVDAVAHYEELLRLNPDDNQGLRYLLAIGYLELGDDRQLGRLLAQYEDDDSAAIAFTRALLQYRQIGPGREADRLLAEAFSGNPHVPTYLLGEKRLPAGPPAFIGYGDDLEAVSYAWEFGDGWRGTKGALDWLRSRVR